MKYYQKSLAELARTLSEEEKAAVKKLTEQFFNQHHYFSNVWVFLNSEKKEKDFGNCFGRERDNSLWINYWHGFVLFNAWKRFLGKNWIFSDLKQSAVNDVDYENSKYLYQSLKMRNLGDMNDLYNAQDVILLCGIIESRFQMMNNKYRFNPRKCNSASSMSSCI